MWERLLLPFQHGPESSFNDRNGKNSYTCQIIIPRVPPNDMKEYKPYNTKRLQKICRQHVNHIVMLLYGTHGITHIIQVSIRQTKSIWKKGDQFCGAAGHEPNRCGRHACSHLWKCQGKTGALGRLQKLDVRF